ncbi:MAG: hypothetical protein DSM106950_27695 [Stigonema ocellatum SAG 48.90 = DSM 106950]|nr:hypothetical protein [Stigonema ocellatum SAG 48.90 = DSM 106950]
MPKSAFGQPFKSPCSKFTPPGDRTQAHTSIQSAISFAKGAGQPISTAALNWLNRHAAIPV